MAIPGLRGISMREFLGRTWREVLILGGEMNAVIEHASEGGKAAGARAPGEAPPPRWERPSAMPPGVVKSGEVARHAEAGDGR